MQEITIALQEPLKEYLDAQIATGEYSNATEFFNHLLLEDQKRRAKEYLKRVVRKAEASGAPLEVTPEYWAEVRKKFHDKFGKGQTS